MLVRCRSNLGADLPPACRDERMGVGPSTVFSLTVGDEYVVYAVTNLLDTAWYYVLEDAESEYPVWNPAPLFDVVDGRVPTHWVFQNYILADWGSSYFLLSYPEWATDEHYYERLVDGELEAVALFNNERARPG